MDSPITLIRRVARKFLSLTKEQELAASNALPSKVIIHPTSVTQDCIFADWVNIQKECYFYNSSIGSYTYFAGFDSVMNANIGKFCSIGAFVSIGPGRHPIDFVSTSPVFFSHRKQCGTTFTDQSYYNELGSVSIGNDVWIGTNAVILDDVTIGDGAVVAAGAIVTASVEPYTIVGGVPAKVIRKRFSEDVIAQLLESKWWDKDEEWLKANFRSFHDVDSFKSLLRNSPS